MLSIRAESVLLAAIGGVLCMAIAAPALADEAAPNKGPARRPRLPRRQRRARRI
jgi:hypothetical protein